MEYDNVSYDGNVNLRCHITREIALYLARKHLTPLACSIHASSDAVAQCTIASSTMVDYIYDKFGLPYIRNHIKPK